MKFNILHLIVFVLSSFAFGQTPSLDKLRRSRDVGRSVLNGMQNIKPNSPSSFVNTFVGTGGHGHTYPGASAPFGMMQLSPDTRHEGWDGCGGYHYDDSVIYGFSHTHLSGTGIPDYADLLICPQSGIPQTEPKFLNPNGYGHAFSHADEVSAPGFYSVDLKEAGIKASMTVSERAGMHRYEFTGANSSKYILLDLDYRDQLLSGGFNILSNTTINGSRISKDWALEQHFYFFLESNVPWTNVKEIKANNQHKLLIKFDGDARIIQLKVGMSAVSTEGAEKNLRAEITDWNFEKIKATTLKKWNDELGKIDYHTKDKTLKTIFYTALYHSFLSPNIFSDVDGQYRGLDQQIHRLDYPDDMQYTVFSLWDTFRAAHPLFTLVQQDRTKRFLQTFERHYLQSGDLPVWELAANETECMIGYHSVSVIQDAYSKGLRAGDPQTFLKAMLETSNRNEFGKKEFQGRGFISLNKEPESVSKALEYAYNDFCIAQFATSLGEKELAKKYTLNAFNFINHFDPSTGFFRARRSGRWFAPFVPEEVNFNYTEANAWHYSMFAPHAVNTLKSLHLQRNSLETHLTSMFNASTKTTGREQADITGLIGQYAQGNEPSHHMAYLYNYVGRSDLTQSTIDLIQKEQYRNAPDGLSGNEDCGQMSAWYVMSALGIYQVSPGNPFYDFGRPIPDSATLHLENGKKLQLIFKNQSPSNKFIQSISRNGTPYNNLFVAHEDLMIGGKWVFEMGDKPNDQVLKMKPAPTWGEIPKEFTPAPIITNEERIFDQSIEVSIGLPLKSDTWEIEYRLKEQENWQKYVRPFTIEKSTTVFARTKNLSTQTYGTEVESSFRKNIQTLEIKIESEFVNQYSAGGNEALIDGLEGENEYRTGDWQGYYGQDVKFTLQPKEPKTNYTLEIGTLEDLKTWIFFPSNLEVEYSEDGTNFSKISTKIEFGNSNAYRPSNRSTIVQKISSSAPIKVIRVTLKNQGNCPEWHLGAGNPTWIFVDEVKLN